MSFGKVTIVIAFLPWLTSFFEVETRKPRFVVPDSTETRLPDRLARVLKCSGLPFLTVLAPSERYHRKRHRRHKTLLDWGRQMLLQLRRWLPECPPLTG